MLENADFIIMNCIQEQISQKPSLTNRKMRNVNETIRQNMSTSAIHKNLNRSREYRQRYLSRKRNVRWWKHTHGETNEKPQHQLHLNQVCFVGSTDHRCAQFLCFSAFRAVHYRPHPLLSLRSQGKRSTSTNSYTGENDHYALVFLS